MSAIDDFARALERDGPHKCLSIMREKYTNTGTLRNRVREVRERALARMPSWKPASATLEAGENLHSFLKLSREAQVREQLRVRKSSDLTSPDDRLIKDAPLVPRFISELRLTHAENEAIRLKSKEQIEKRSQHVALIDSDRAKEFLMKCNRALCDSSTSAKETLVAVALVTGRRTAEILLTGEFDAPQQLQAETDNEFKACFRGQLKAGIRDPNRCYTIPLLAPRACVTAAIAKLRARWPLSAGSRVSDVNRRFASTARRAALAHLTELHPSLTHLHAARQLYAIITYHACQPHTYSMHGWIRRVLGHADLDVSKAYANVTLTGDIARIADLGTGDNLFL
tara:strand:+ start:465 stop:1487 length:1023 start_codon:yes stop_codon:yes gene_type:complete